MDGLIHQIWKRRELMRKPRENDGKPKILEEIGKKFGVTRERIRQLQNIALAKLRRALAKREKPNVRRDPIQFLKPVSSDPKTTLHLILESSANDM